MIPLLLLLSLPLSTLSSFCGEAAIPFSFQALRQGAQPVLGCARPACFGRTREGLRVQSAAPALFYRINGKEDGYVRRSDASAAQTATGLASTHATRFTEQTAECDENYRVGGCGEDEWVGGIAPLTDFANAELQIRCCRYEPLKSSEDRGIATVRAGQLVIGGETGETSDPQTFDYISNIVKIKDEAGNITYSVYMRRYQCSSHVSKLEVPHSEAAVVVPIADSEPEDLNPPPQPEEEINRAEPPNYPMNQQQSIVEDFPGQQQPQPHFLPPTQLQQNAVAPYPPQQQQLATAEGYPTLYPQSSGGRAGRTGQPLPLAQGQYPSVAPQPGQLPPLPDISKMRIPSIEEVERSMSPEQRRFLTNLAHFFGVL